MLLYSSEKKNTLPYLQNMYIQIYTNTSETEHIHYLLILAQSISLAPYTLFFTKVSPIFFVWILYTSNSNDENTNKIFLISSMIGLVTHFFEIYRRKCQWAMGDTKFYTKRFIKPSTLSLKMSPS